MNNYAEENFKVVKLDDKIVGCGRHYVKHEAKLIGIAWVMFKRFSLGPTVFLYLSDKFFENILNTVSKENSGYDIVINTTQLLEKTFNKYGFFTEEIVKSGFGENLDHYKMRRKGKINKMLHYKTYELSPEKEWVVFVHGAGGSSSIWFRQLKEFCLHFNVLMLDLRGHGGSKDFFEKYVKDDYTFNDVSRDVLEVLDFLKIKTAHFVGISLGCIIIRTIGEMAPKHVKSMILGGAIIRLNIRSNFLMQAGNLLKKVVPFMWLYRLFAWVIMPKKRHRKSRSLFIQEAKRLAQKEFIRWYKMTAEVNPLLKYFREKEIDIPTLYVMGEEDYMFLPPVQQISKRHKSATLEILENCGHVVNVDQPDKFNEIVIKFIHAES